ncbi:hypothetical protein SDC9_190064 [bioreactor metagenome]|uniref:Uncharacterized protein n=1 Tax=bioreactor metagenome TaxID=1076179 RepID=A0A645HU53_9ZZZZ
MRHFKHTLKTDQVTLVHPGYLTGHLLLITHFGQREHPAFAPVPKQNPHFVSRTQSRQHTLGTISRHLVAIHELHAVHDQNDCARRKDLLAVQFHTHRQHRFQGCAAIAACGIGLRTTHTHEAHTEIADRAFKQLLPGASQVTCGEVADKDGIIVLKFGQGSRKSA